jgi:ribulose-phosphate 3-epimerase
MAQIVPAILEQEKHAFDDKVFALTRLPGVERIQVDFCDGKFVETTTIEIQDVEPLNPAFEWEAHLMIDQPHEFLDYRIAGFKTVIVHYEAYPNAIALEQAIDAIISHGLTPGIAINPETSVDGLPHYAEKVSHFTILSVHPGKQGQPFIPETFERLQSLRKLLPNAIIEVDGGVSLENGKQLAESGANLLIAGSHLLKSDNLADTYANFVQEASG